MKILFLTATFVCTIFGVDYARADSYYDYKNGKRYTCTDDESTPPARGSACFCKDIGYGVYRFELRKVDGSMDWLIRAYDNERNCQIAVNSDPECF